MVNVNIDIALLDIDLNNGINGIDIAKILQAINPWVIIIFITSHMEFAIDAFGINATGYLRKPVDEKALKKVLNKAIIQLNGIAITRRNSAILSFDKEGLILKEMNIIYIDRDDNYVVFHMNKGDSHELLSTLTNVDKKLSGSFIRINKSIIINMAFIYVIHKDIVELSNGLSFKISGRKVKIFNKAYSCFLESTCSIQ